MQTENLSARRKNYALSPTNPQIDLGSAVAATKILITVGIHGDEPCGMIGFNELLTEGFFNSLPSSVAVTALVGNPAAVSKRQRFIEQNLNRMIREDLFKQPSYEAQRGFVVANAIQMSDVVLDLHSCSAKAPPHALPSGSKLSGELASKLPVAYVIKGLAHTTPGRASTMDWAKKKNKVAVCIECGQHAERETIDNAKNCIKSLVGLYCGLSMCDMKLNWNLKPIVLISKENEPVRKNFRFIRNITAFEKIPYGETIAVDIRGPIISRYVGGTFIVMPTSNPILGEEAFFCAVEEHC